MDTRNGFTQLLNVWVFSRDLSIIAFWFNSAVNWEDTLNILKESVRLCLGSFCPQHSLEKTPLSKQAWKSSWVLLSRITFCCYLRSSILKRIVSYILLYFPILLRQEAESESCQSIFAGNTSLKFVLSIMSFEWTFQQITHIKKFWVETFRGIIKNVHIKKISLGQKNIK